MSCHHVSESPATRRNEPRTPTARRTGDVGDAERPRQVARRGAEADDAQHAVAGGEEAAVGEHQREEVARHEAARAR